MPGGVTVERMWEVPASNYGQPVSVLTGFSEPVFGIAPDGGEVVLSGGEYSTSLRHFAMSDGGTVATDPVTALWRDLAWTIQGEANGDVLVRALATGQPIMTLDPGLLYVPSGDGRRVIASSCPGGQTSVEALAVPSGQLELGQLIDAGCPSPLVTTSLGDAVLFSSGGRTELHRIDLLTGAHAYARAHAGGSVVAIKLSPTERSVATVGDDAILRLWSYPGLQEMADVPVVWTTPYDGCYCGFIRFAPVAWSSDDALLASADADANTVLRRGCDGVIVATLPGPTQALRSQSAGGKWGPVFLSFGPGDETLAVFYEGSLALYRVHRGA